MIDNEIEELLRSRPLTPTDEAYFLRHLYSDPTRIGDVTAPTSGATSIGTATEQSTDFVALGRKVRKRHSELLEEVANAGGGELRAQTKVSVDFTIGARSRL